MALHGVPLVNNLKLYVAVIALYLAVLTLAILVLISSVGKHFFEWLYNKLDKLGAHLHERYELKSFEILETKDDL